MSTSCSVHVNLADRHWLCKHSITRLFTDSESNNVHKLQSNTVHVNLADKHWLCKCSLTCLFTDSKSNDGSRGLHGGSVPCLYRRNSG